MTLVDGSGPFSVENYSGEIYPDTVGKPAPEVEIKIADTGEVLFRGPGVFQAYYKNDEGTAATKTRSDWQSGPT